MSVYNESDSVNKLSAEEENLGGWFHGLDLGHEAIGCRAKAITNGLKLVREVSENLDKTITNDIICGKWVESSRVPPIGATPYFITTYSTEFVSP